jgi:hypothetical protein
VIAAGHAGPLDRARPVHDDMDQPQDAFYRLHHGIAARVDALVEA